MSTENGISFRAQIMKSLCLNSDKADIFFVIHENGQQERISAHKCILACGSPVFNTVFYGDQPKQETEIPITDSSAAAFKLFMQFFYLDTVCLSYDNAIEVLQLAQKFQVIECFETYARFMQRHLKIDNVCSAFAVANTFSQQMTNFLQVCREYIANNLQAVLETDNFRCCPTEILKEILEIAREKNYNRIKIFSAAMNWSSHACEKKNINKELSKNLRHQLGDVFNLIAFDQMTLDEFAQCLTKRSNLFESVELEKVIIAIAKASNKKRRSSNADRNDENPQKKNVRK
ncbi:BTB/POZ domain-containing protein 6-A-like [Sitodiplosis mosellana]|uniref:BTB/POZ domain-containing protein 6-A-like n=1 Tax=Sitodiplosis mosellana TaxID=263140 RepID=UPI0024441FC4|nr:BTB/POZ domain-containing protein 6-A-like [Sitodiplosis mosellana]